MLRPARAALGVTVAAALLLAEGCCHVPRAERYFDRGDPFTTVNGFTYAIDVGDWRYAYDCLTERSRKLFTFTLFKFAMLFNEEVPEIEVPIRDLILGSERERFRLWESGTRRDAYLQIQYRLPRGGDVLRPNIYLARESEAEAKAAGREEPAWLIDLDRTLRELGARNAGGVGEAPAEFR